MATAWDDVLRNRLEERRQRLQTAAGSTRTAELMSLLEQVESTLERLDSGPYGRCERCHHPIEQARILANPLVEFCLGCLTEEQRNAFQRDLDLAGRIQAGLLPKNRNFKGWEVGFHYEPAGAVSGDYCDLVNDEADLSGLVFLLGDVSGKGIAASLLMTHLHAIFRSLIPLKLPVSALVETANRIFSESTISSHYATLVCGRADGAGMVEVCNAGHCPPVVLRAGKTPEIIEASGLPVGMFCGLKYSSQKLELAPGDTLLLYTDGVSEARDRADNEYGAGRLAAVADRGRDLAPHALVSALLEDFTHFRSGEPARDDVTIMVVRRLRCPVN